MVRPLWIIVVAAAFMACTSDRSFGPDGVIGEYTLTQMGAERMPSTLKVGEPDPSCGSGGTITVTVSAGQLRLLDTRQFRLHLVYAIECVTATGLKQARQEIEQDSGTFGVRGEFIELHSTNGKKFEAEESDGILRFLFQPWYGNRPLSMMFTRVS